MTVLLVFNLIIFIVIYEIGLPTWFFNGISTFVGHSIQKPHTRKVIALFNQ